MLRRIIVRSLVIVVSVLLLAAPADAKVRQDACTEFFALVGSEVERILDAVSAPATASVSSITAGAAARREAARQVDVERLIDLGLRCHCRERVATVLTMLLRVRDNLLELGWAMDVALYAPSRIGDLQMVRDRYAANLEAGPTLIERTPRCKPRKAAS